ncbi:MAG: hypothetical protein R3Y56_02060 [Akkermansia sp.]
MAIHIQMSEEAEKELRRTALRNKLSSLLACLIFMLVGGSILYFSVILISKALPPAFDVYTPAADNAAPSNKPKVKELTSKSVPQSSSVAPSVIVSAGASPVAMAEVDIPSADIPVGTGMEIDMDLGAGLGEGLGDSGGGMGSGDSGGSALEGTYYDFKQTKNGASTGITWDKKTFNVQGIESLNKLAKILGEFINKNWSPSVLNKYYQAETKLYASNFLIPDVSGMYGPIAFQAEKKIKPAAWAAVYRGKVRAPKSGRFRFVGAGNHLICVRFDKKLVLEAGWAIPSLYKASDKTPWKTWCDRLGISPEYKNAIKAGKDRNHKDYKLYPNSGTPGWNAALGGLVGGDIIKVEEGKVYPIEILVCDPAGGTFGFALLMEDIDNPVKLKDKNGSPLLDIFRTNFSLPNQKELVEAIKAAKVPLHGKENQFPNYNPDSLIWTAVP